MKKLFILLSLTLSIHAFGQPGQQKRALYEFDYDIPVYYDSIHAMLTYPLAWRNCRQTLSFDQWREKARQRVLELMGPQPPRTTDWNMRVLAEEQRDGYRARKIEFSLSRWYRVRALLLIPDGGGKHPAVNLLHDHGAHLYIGKEKMIRPLDEDTAVVNDADRWCRMLYENQYLGDYLARHGYVVFSADAPLWGDRGRKEGVDRAKYDIIAGNMMELGRNLCAQMHYDDIAGTDFLASLPCVDADRIGAAGCSMGAYRTWMLAALTDKVKVIWKGGERRLRQLHPGSPQLLGLSGHRVDSLSEAHALHQRDAGSTLSRARRQEGLRDHAACLARSREGRSARDLYLGPAP